MILISFQHDSNMKSTSYQKYMWRNCLCIIKTGLAPSTGQVNIVLTTLTKDIIRLTYGLRQTNQHSTKKMSYLNILKPEETLNVGEFGPLQTSQQKKITRDMRKPH